MLDTVQPALPRTEQFDGIIQEGGVKYAVSPEGEMAVIPTHVQGEEDPLSVIFDGKAVAGAGEAEIAGSAEHGYYGLEITNHGGHYLPSDASLDTARDAFRQHGIEF